MEERIVDDEYGRGVRMKKTKDGYVDVTDEQLEDEQMQDGQEQDEVEFQFPIMEMEEDDEDLVGLSPEEALALRKQKEEEERLRQEEAARRSEEQRRTDEEDNRSLIIEFENFRDQLDARKQVRAQYLAELAADRARFEEERRARQARRNGSTG